ncbi:hypothetical protein ACYOEI_12455 [Singulisphaera rosea]
MPIACVHPARLAMLLCLGILPLTSKADEKSAAKAGEKPASDKAEGNAQTPVEVQEWSIWVGNPALTTINSSRVYRNAMPSVVGTSRPKFEEKELSGKFPVEPISVVQFFGEPSRDVDVDIRVKKGMILAHWPASTERGGRLQWFGSDLNPEDPPGIPQSYLPENHWFHKLRVEKTSLVLKHETHFERFIAYDTELSIPIPLRLRGGPDEYSLQNLTARKLTDVAVIAPSDDGFRVGWLDELPTAAPEKKEEAKDKDKKKETPNADAVFQEAEAKPKEEEEAIPPLPAEGDANVRAQIDQVLNRPISVTVNQMPRREVLDLIAGQTRLQFELDDRTIAKAEINLGEPTSLRATNLAARDALADVLGGAGLSYRVTEAGKLFITTSVRLAEDTGKKGGVVEGPPVKLLMSQPVKPSAPTFREVTRDTLTRRLAGQGLRPEVIKLLLDQYSKALFEPGELIVLAHVSRETIDEAVLLDVFPPPKKIVRTALLVIHGIDPRLQDRARGLVKQLGDDSPKTRETAESKLLELGPVAVPVLEEALSNKDVEIVFRSERLLLRLNRPVP